MLRTYFPHFIRQLTGIPIFASERIQINLDVRRYGVPSRFLNLNDIVFPLIWVNEVKQNYFVFFVAFNCIK